MPPPDKQSLMKPSLLDRLADPLAFSTTGTVGFGIENMKKSIQQDVMELLNTKLNVLDVSENMELYDSILTFGLPDMVTMTGSSDDQARSMARHVQDILTRFEPRLARVRVIANPQGRETDRREVKFHVEAVLNIEPYKDFVGFETILELTTGRAKVSVEKN